MSCIISRRCCATIQFLQTTEQAAHLAWEHGIAVTPEALWRNRGTLESGGMPTWRG
jgi:hypothetical protein